METVLEIGIPAQPEFIAIVRLVVSSFAAARRAVADERVSDLKLAVSEACTNAIEAQHRAGHDDLVSVRIVEGEDRLEVRVRDTGEGFDPDALAVHPPVTDPDRLNFERGLGIPLIRTLVDQVVFDSTERGTTVIMTLFGGPATESGDLTSEILRTVLEGE